MKGNLFLPDTSAILTMMDNEEGADVVEGILRTREILLPAVVLFEVYYKTIQNRGMEVAELRYATLKSIKAKHIAELTEPVLLKGGGIQGGVSDISCRFYHCSLCVSLRRNPRSQEP